MPTITKYIIKMSVTSTFKIPKIICSIYSKLFELTNPEKHIHIHPNHINPQMPKVKIHLRTPRGVGTTPPWILVFPSEFFGNISHGYVFGVKESNGDNEKIPSSLYDLENQGQTPFCMTFHISGCKHYTKLILVSILTFSRSRISKMLKTNP